MSNFNECFKNRELLHPNFTSLYFDEDREVVVDNVSKTGPPCPSLVTHGYMQLLI